MMNVKEITSQIFTIDDFLSKEECDRLIALSESIGYEEAMIETEKGSKRVAEVRNNNRILFSNEELSLSLWEKLKNYVPKVIGNSYSIGLNELFRFYKYNPGQKFKKHIDQSYIRNEVEASYYTFMIYLNNDFEGGETKFKNESIRRETGKALIFLHSLEHEGAEVTSGTKYVLRSDVMYRLKAE